MKKLIAVPKSKEDFLRILQEALETQESLPDSPQKDANIAQIKDHLEKIRVLEEIEGKISDINKMFNTLFSLISTNGPSPN